MTPDALIEAWVRSITHSHLVLGHLNPKGWVGKWPLAHSDQAHMKWEFSNQIEPAWGTSHVFDQLAYFLLNGEEGNEGFQIRPG